MIVKEETAARDKADFLMQYRKSVRSVLVIAISFSTFLDQLVEGSKKPKGNRDAQDLPKIYL